MIYSNIRTNFFKPSIKGTSHLLILYISSYYNKAYPRLAIKTFLAMVVLDYLIFTHYTFLSSISLSTSRSPSWLAVSRPVEAVLRSEESGMTSPTSLAGEAVEVMTSPVRSQTTANTISPPLTEMTIHSVQEEDEEEEEAYYSDSDSFVTIDSDSDTIENSGDSDSAIGSESFCVNPFFN